MSSRATATSRIPADIGCVLIGAWIGGTSGLRGVMLAPALGGLFPRGPMVSFPRALAVWQMGAGQAQVIAFLAAWSAFAVYRIISYELPLIGPGFVLLRLSSYWMLLSPLAGFIAAIILVIVVH